MPMAQDDIADLQKILKKARQKPLPFGLCLGKKPEDNVMCMDLKKNPEVMMRKAKAEGDTGKVTYGMADVKGKILTLSLEGKMLPGLAKNMKMFMSKQGMKMKVVIADQDGNELESDGDENIEDDVLANDNNDVSDTDENVTPEQQDENAENEAPTDDPMMGQWSKVSTALDPHVERFTASGHKKAAAIATAWNSAKAAAAKADYKTAMAVAAKVKPLVTAAPNEPDDTAGNNSETAQDPNQAKWTAKLKEMQGLYTDAMGKNPENRTKLQAAWAIANEKAEGGDYAGGLAILERLQPSLEKVMAAQGTGQEAEIPKDVVAFQKSRILWGNTKGKMRSELQALVSAIQAACNDDEDLADVGAEAPSLLTRLDVFDDQLETILDDITNTAEGAQRDKLKADAVKKISEYQSALQNGFFADVDKNNGFANVSVTATATASLASISKVLAA